MNALPKYVVSTTAQELSWNNSRVLKGSLHEAVGNLKRDVEQDIVVHGSRMLTNSLVQLDLVDEFHLLVYPIVLGAGQRLFQEGTQTTLELNEAKTFEKGVTALRYRRPTA